MLNKRLIKSSAAVPSIINNVSKANFSTSSISHEHKHPLPNVFGVVGAGQMGTGIAVVAAMNAKIPIVRVHDAFPKSIEKSKDFVNGLLKKYEEKGKITKEEKEIIMSERLQYSSDMSNLSDAQFIVEAATEQTELKLNLFRELSALVKDDTILATNTSSISITKIASITKKPEQVIGMHFMNPVPVMTLVELIRGLQTSDETYERTVKLAHQMHKTCTLSIKDSPGFIANRILMPYINEAVNVLHEGIANVEDIDKTMKLGTNVPMGPLTLADFIGLDTCLAIMRVLYTEFADSKYRPSPLLVKMVEAGWLGKKTGRGFYKY